MLSLIRIDDRLIHGQVMAVWVRALNINHIVIVDDPTAADEFSQQVMRLAIPRSIRLSICRVSDASPILQNCQSSNEHVLVLLRDVESAARLQAFCKLESLNLGGSGMIAGRELVWRSIALSPQQMLTIDKLQQDGVDVYLQMIPSDDKRRYSSAAWRALAQD